MLSRFLYGSLAALLLSSHAKAEDQKEDYKIDGYLRSALESDTLRNADLFHEAKLTFKTKRRKGMRAVLEIDAETKKDALDVREVLIQRRWDHGQQWELGYSNKDFGLEYEEGSLERLTIDRSYVYRKLDVFTYTGRETGFRFSSSESSKDFPDWAAFIGVSEAQNLSLLFNWQHAFDEQLRWGSWFQLVSDKIEKGRQIAGTMSHALWSRNQDSRWQVEAHAGLDPDQTEFHVLYEDARKVYFADLHGLYERLLWQEDEESFQLVGGTGVFAPDLKASGVYDLNLLLGARYRFDRLRVGLNLDIVSSNSTLDKASRNYEESRAVLEALYEI